MPLIKSYQSRLGGSNGVVMDLADLERQAADVVTRARAEAGRLMVEQRQAAEREAETIREQARAAGHTAGYSAGFAEGQTKGHNEAVAAMADKLKKMTERWGGALETLEREMPAHVAETQTDVLKMAVAIAARVTKLQGARDHAVAVKNVEAALQLVGAGRTVVVSAHTDDIAALERYVPELIAKMRQISAIEVKADPALSTGDCVVRFGAGEVDARLQTQVERIANELLGIGE